MDLRQVALAFNNSGRIESILVQEGDSVKKGQLVATLDRGLILPDIWPLVAIGLVTLPIASWMFRHRLT